MLILTSWDDGHPSDLRLAELLRKYNLQGTFFVPIKNRENKAVMNEREIAELGADFEVGGHTLNHQYLTKLQSSDLEHEIVEGKIRLENILGRAVQGFCYPGGEYDHRVINAVKKAGFSYARTVENLQFDLGKTAWTMPTSYQFFPHGSYVFLKNTIKFPKISKLNLIMQRFLEKDFLCFLEKQINQLSNVEQVFHIWGHSWEIDQYDLWADLEKVFSFLSRTSHQSLSLGEAHTRSDALRR